MVFVLAGREVFCGRPANCLSKSDEVQAVDADSGEAVPSVRLTSPGSNSANFTTCSTPSAGCFGGFGRSAHPLRLEADGDQAVNFTIEVGSDVCGHPIEQRRVVQLAKVGSATKSLVREETASISGCE